MKPPLNVYHVTVPYGRGEMTAHYLVAARSPLKAKRLGNLAAPCTVPLHCVKCWQVENTFHTGKEPTVICRT